MSNVELFSTALCKRYTASRLSCAYAFSIVCTTLFLILPLFLCYSPKYASNGAGTPGGIWKKIDTYHEQPKVKFRHQFIFVAQAKGISIDDSFPKEIFYSTIRSVNAMKSENLRMASVKAREVDQDLDGVMDRFYLDAQLPLQEGEQIYGIQALLFFDYRLQNHVKIDMESLVYVYHSSGLPGTSFTSRGDLTLRQNSPIGVRDDFSTLYADNPLLDMQDAAMIASETNVKNIIEKYELRSFGTDYIQRFPIWTRDLAYIDTNSTFTGVDYQRRTFNFRVTVDIPSMQHVTYIPTLPEVLIEAWIRYLSFLIVIGFILRKILCFFFAHQILACDCKVE